MAARVARAAIRSAAAASSVPRLWRRPGCEVARRLSLRSELRHRSSTAAPETAAATAPATASAAASPAASPAPSPVNPTATPPATPLNPMQNTETAELEADDELDLVAALNEQEKSQAEKPSVGLQAQLVFDRCWHEAEETFGPRMCAPREIIWLNGAPGSGKGSATPFIKQSRGLNRTIVVSDLLENDPECKALMEEGKLIDDSKVGRLLLSAIFESQAADGAGVIVDGFPRTGDQVDFLKLLYDKLEAKHKQHTSKDGVTSPRWPRPAFRVVVLYVDEKVSIERQLARAEKVRRHNIKARDAGIGRVQKERATDNDRNKSAHRYRVFKEHYTTLLRLQQFFPFTLIDAMGSLDECKYQIAQELRYQSDLDLAEKTYDKISHIPLASELVNRARQQLVARLDRYSMQSEALFNEVISILDNEVLPLLRRVSLSGHAKFVTTNPTFADPIAVEILIDILSDRGFFVSHQMQTQHIPSRVRHDGTIECIVEDFHQFRIEFEVPDIRRRAKRDDYIK